MANYADHIAASEAGYVQKFYLQSSVRATFSSFDKLCFNTDTDFIAAQAARLMLHSGTEKNVDLNIVLCLVLNCCQANFTLLELKINAELKSD